MKRAPVGGGANEIMPQVIARRLGMSRCFDAISATYPHTLPGSSRSQLRLKDRLGSLLCLQGYRSKETQNLARIPLLDENNPATPPDARDALLRAGAACGRLINVYRAMANRPDALNAMTGLIAAVYRKDSTLEPKDSELAYLTATTVNDCFY